MGLLADLDRAPEPASHDREMNNETMEFERPEDFYRTYDRQRPYVRSDVRRRHIREFDRNLWKPGRFQPGHRVLELGCGIGQFLAFLETKGVGDFIGVEMDPRVRELMSPTIGARVVTATIDQFLGSYQGGSFDRIVLLDVFEHFAPGEGVALLRRLVPLLAEDGRIVLRIPNMASPWGVGYQFNDLTHKAFYTPQSIRQLALAVELDCLANLPYTRGNLRRRMTSALVERLLSKLLTDPPAIWTAMFVAVLGKMR